MAPAYSFFKTHSLPPNALRCYGYMNCFSGGRWAMGSPHQHATKLLKSHLRTAIALEMAARARLGGAGALEMVARTRSEPQWRPKTLLEPASVQVWSIL